MYLLLLTAILLNVKCNSQIFTLCINQMIPKPANGIEAGQYFLGERHCILVAASNPYPIPSQLELPKISDGFCEVETYSSMTDAKKVAERFIQVALKKFLPLLFFGGLIMLLFHLAIDHAKIIN